MTPWQSRIIDAFVSRYCDSAAGNDEAKNSMRLRSVSIFPDFDAAAADEKESYLEAAESLERQGFLTLKWERRAEGEHLKTLTCPNVARLFALSGRQDPKTAAEETRLYIEENLASLDAANAAHPFLHYLADNLGSSDAARGIDTRAVRDFFRLAETVFSRDDLPAHSAQTLTTRALSVSLYHDSKRLEALIDLFQPLVEKARKAGVTVPDLAPIDRSFPEVWIAGKIEITTKNTKDTKEERITDESGAIIGLPLSVVERITRISPVESAAPAAVLMIENKETFHVLARRLPIVNIDALSFTVCLYVGGHPNRAVKLLVRRLAESGFTLYHSGDLDPDGILILQELAEAAGCAVTPIRMDAGTFDRYLPYARKLPDTVLRHIALIKPETLAIPGLAALVERIRATGVGVEQEIIEYQ